MHKWLGAPNCLIYCFNPKTQRNALKQPWRKKNIHTYKFFFESWNEISSWSFNRLQLSDVLIKTMIHVQSGVVWRARFHWEKRTCVQRRSQTSQTYGCRSCSGWTRVAFYGRIWAKKKEKHRFNLLSQSSTEAKDSKAYAKPPSRPIHRFFYYWGLCVHPKRSK